MSSNDEGEKINSTTLIKSLVESLRYLTCIRLDIFFRVELMSRFMETPTMTYFKALKWILWYINHTIDFGLFYEYSNSFNFVGYNDIDWVRDMNDRKSAMSFVFYIGDIIHMEFK